MEYKNGLSYILNHQNYTADVAYSPNAEGDIYISRCIIHQSSKFAIISIEKNSFYKNHKFKSLKFAEDSKLHLVENDSFVNSSINSITIPSSVEELKEGWCNSTPKLVHVRVSENNKYYKVQDDSIIVGKSDKDNDNYDPLFHIVADLNQFNLIRIQNSRK